MDYLVESWVTRNGGGS